MAAMTGAAYRYFGLIFGRRDVRLSLDSASLGTDAGDHAAVWAGINAAANRAWVQGGIEIEVGDEWPYVYVEVGKDGGQNYFKRAPWQFGVPLTVKLRRSVGRGWTATVPGLTVAPVRIGVRGTIDATLETYGDVIAAGTINGRKVIATRGTRDEIKARIATWKRGEKP